LFEVPTRRRTRALVESDAALQVAAWEYSAAAWPEVVRSAPSPGWRVTLVSALLTTLAVTLVAGVSTNDLRGLWLGAAWAVVWSSALQAWFSHRDAALANHPKRTLRMTRSIVMLGDQLFILNPEPALPELGAGVFLHHCVASPRAAGDSTHFAGSLTWTCLLLSRNSHRRVAYRFPIPNEHAHDVENKGNWHPGLKPVHSSLLQELLSEFGVLIERHEHRGQRARVRWRSWFAYWPDQPPMSAIHRTAVRLEGMPSGTSST
jgi:hypothetical protein